MAKRRYPKSSLRNPNTPLGDIERSQWEGGPDEKVLSMFASASENYSGHFRARAFNSSRYSDYSDLDTKTSGRPGMRWRDYDAFRPDEARPTKHEDIMLAVDDFYKGEGIIRNIIDLMGDFACQGVRLVHPNKRIEKFYRNWFARVGGKERSERFLNYLYRTGNVIVRKQTAKIPVKVEKEIYRSVADPDIKVSTKKVASREIPWKYTFLHPATVIVVGGPLASFVGEPTYAIKLPMNLRRIITSPKNPVEEALVAELPAEIREAATKNSAVILPPDKTAVYHYKKDDWDAWALPMIYSIMEDLVTLGKLKLADRAALDGAISNIRVWKIGNMEHKIPPTAEAAGLLSDILENNTGVGTMDLVWGPDIDLLESNTQVHKFLGEEKYKPTMNNIYAGLGIPPTLTGTFGAAGTTNNFISLKTLTQRLQYGRDVLRKFWESEIALVQKAMGFRLPAKVEFDETNLADEDAQKALLIQLADRNLISDERLQETFKIEPNMEKIRLNRELRDREAGRMVPKSGQFYDPQFGVALKKVALTTGVVTPGQVGLREEEVRPDLKMYPKAKGEKTALEQKPTPAGPGGSGPKKTTKKAGGRPGGAKDSTTRKTKKFTPRGKAAVEIWASFAQEAISQYVNDDLLKFYEKKNMRSLSSKETEEVEEVKFGILCHLEPMGVLDEKAIFEALELGVPSAAKTIYKDWVHEVEAQLDRQLTLDETRRLQAALYSELSEDDE